jgi:hypothetical protein
MPHPGLSVTLLALALPVLGAGDRVSRARVEAAQLTIRERIVIRVPRMPMATAAPKPIKWKEKKGPKCVAAAGMAGALISARNQVDLVMVGGKRLRVKLDGDCRPLDYYGGFYLRPASDGMICADRDAIRVRSGASCEIDQFRLLEASK